ncbi:hypothetical protein [Adlercreutzia sp. ZJ304]|uniref:hypothetical protein n=1 Tax=Adlercreutzia sp. ZJ304 TaxID=2709791 RepID=UPI0013E9A794|nr:hypothetical protein [Adlercreutzia sp. ZJ304]
MKATAIPKKVACIASALALSLTMVPVVPMVGGADTQALAAEGSTDTPPVISVTAPFKVTFGSKENPYDINNPTNFMSTTSYFQNGGTLGLSVYEVECNAPANYGASGTIPVVVKSTTDKAALNTGDKNQRLFSVWDASKADSEAIHFGYANNGDTNKLKIQDQSINKLIAVPQGSTTNVNYRINLGNGLCNAAINPDAAQSYDSRVRQDLGTVKFTFGRCAPIGDERLTKKANEVESAGNCEALFDQVSNTVFYLRDAASKQVYSLDQVKKSATQLSELNASGAGKEKQSLYYDMYQQFIESDEGEDYECRTKWTLPDDATLADPTKQYTIGSPITIAKESVYRLRILDTLYDYDTENNRKAGITFQFKNAYNKNPNANLQMYKSAEIAANNGYKASWIRAIMNPGNPDDQYNNEEFGTDTNEIWNAIPSDMQSRIVQIGKFASTNAEACDQVSAPSKIAALNKERLFIASYAETFGSENIIISCGAIEVDKWAWLKYEGSSDGTEQPSITVQPYKFYSDLDREFISTPKDAAANRKWYLDYINLMRYDDGFPGDMGQGPMFRSLYPFGGEKGVAAYEGLSGNTMNLIPEYPNVLFDDGTFVASMGRALHPCFCF